MSFPLNDIKQYESPPMRRDPKPPAGASCPAEPAARSVLAYFRDLLVILCTLAGFAGLLYITYQLLR